MKKILFVLTLTVCYLTGYGQETGTFTDPRNGKVYETVKIGNQIWMTLNLAVDTFRNGESIPYAITNQEWNYAAKNGTPAWCYYNNDPSNGGKYGKLYNWYAVNDNRNICPEGWHVPSTEEWKQLEAAVGGGFSAGLKLKSDFGWRYNINGNNSSGFSALPGGLRFKNSNFYYEGMNGYWWSITSVNASQAIMRFMSATDVSVLTYNYHKKQGLSCRCVKD